MVIFQIGLGIDFRQKSVSVALLRASLTGVKTGAHETLAFPEGIDRTERIRQAARLVREVIGDNRIDALDIFLAIPRELMIVREIELPSSVADSLSSTIAYEMERYIPLPAEEVYLDHVVLSGKARDGKIKVLLVAARKEDVDAYLGISEQIGTRLSGVEFRTTALMDLFAGDAVASGEGFQVFLHSDGEGVELVFFEKENGTGRLRYSRFFSGEEEGTLEESLADAFQEVRNLLDIASDPMTVLHVGGNIPPSFIDRLRRAPGVSLHSVSLQENRRAVDAFSARALAMRGIRQSGNAMNLLPAQERKRSGRIPQYLFFALSALVLLGLLSWGGSVLLRRQLDHRALNSRIAAIRTDVERVQGIEAELMEIRNTVDEINTLSEQRLLFTNILRELTLIIPNEAWVSSLSYDAPELQIEGVAEKAADLIPRIEAAPLFSETKLLSAITREKNGKERFRLGIEVLHD